MKLVGILLPGLLSGQSRSAPEMIKSLLKIFALGLCVTEVFSGCNELNHYSQPSVNGDFSITVPEDTESWKVTVTFDQEVDELNVWNGANVQCDGNTCTFEDASHNGVQNAGDVLNLGYQVHFSANSAVTSMEFNGVNVCNSCPEGWIEAGGKCLQISDHTADFYHAAVKCQLLGGKLTEPKTEEENNELINLINDYDTEPIDDQRFYLGIIDESDEDTFVYLSSGQPITFSSWYTNQPDNTKADEDCVELRMPWNEQWNDRNCDADKRFICEYVF